MNVAEKLDIIAVNQQSIYDAGVEAGKLMSADTEAAFNAGEKAQYDKFWDAFQKNGEMNMYSYAFAHRFSSENFYPKYDIKDFTDGSSVFYNIHQGELFSLTQRLKECSVVLDTSKANLMNSMFAYSDRLTEIPTIDMRGITSRQNSRAAFLFRSCANLVTIEKIILEEDIIFQNWFMYDYELKNITIEGTIGQNGFDVHWSTKLSKASILSILNACNVDVTGKGVTVTLPSSCIDGVTDTQTLMSETGDTELYGALMTARSKGYSIAFA